MPRPAPSRGAHSPSSHASAGGESGEEGAEPEKPEPHDSGASESYNGGHHNDGGHCHGGERPMFATITVAVCHCGAGCVLGDIAGEWLVYGTGATINGRLLWVEYLVGE